MDETYIKVKGQWTYYYRAVDKQGQAIDFLLLATRDRQAARHFFKKAIKYNKKLSLVNIDQSGRAVKSVGHLEFHAYRESAQNVTGGANKHATTAR